MAGIDSRVDERDLHARAGIPGPHYPPRFRNSVQRQGVVKQGMELADRVHRPDARHTSKAVRLGRIHAYDERVRHGFHGILDSCALPLDQQPGIMLLGAQAGAIASGLGTPESALAHPARGSAHHVLGNGFAGKFNDIPARNDSRHNERGADEIDAESLHIHTERSVTM